MKKVLQRCHSWLVMLIAMFAMSMSAMADTETIDFASSWDGTYVTVTGTNANSMGLDAGLVVYQNYTGTFTAKTGYKLTKIEFTLGMGYGQPTPTEGAMTSQTVWENADGSASVTFSYWGAANVYSQAIVTVESATPAGPEPGSFAITGATNAGNAPESEVEALSYMFEITAANAIKGLHEGNISLTNADNNPVGGYAIVFGYEGNEGSTTVYARFQFDSDDHNLHAAGTYTLNVPAGMFEDAEGNLSEAYSATWTIKAPEADPYNSALTVAAGEGNCYLTDKINIGEKEYDAYKIGTSKATGTINVTIPAGSYGMSFYALSWNTAETAVTATAGEKSKEYAATGAGISGNSPYTYDAEKGGEVDTHLYTFGYTEALAEDVTVSLTAPARVVFFGLNALTEAPEPEEPEVTFPEENKAYVIYLPAGKNYLNVVEHELKSARLTNTPEKFFFTKADGGWQIKNEAGLYVGKSTANGWNMNSAVPVNWIVEAVEGGYTLKHNYIDPKDGSNKTGYLAFDNIVINLDNAEQTAAFVDKPADKAAVLDIFEYTFPLTHGVAYKVKNVDAGYYMNISAEENKNVTIEKTPEKIFFDAAENGGFYIKDEDGNYVGHGTSGNPNDDWTVGNNMDYTWNVVEVDGGYAFQRTDVSTKYLGLDSTSEKAAYWTNKGAAYHYAHIIMLFDTPETTPQEDLQAAIDAAKAVKAEDYTDVPADLFEDLAAEIEKAEALAANENAAVSDINAQIAALEAATKAITAYTEPTAEELYTRLKAALVAGEAILAENEVEIDADNLEYNYTDSKAGLPGYKALALIEAVGEDVLAHKFNVAALEEMGAEDLGGMTPAEYYAAMAGMAAVEGAGANFRSIVVEFEHAVKAYNEALPCIPEVGKTYLIRSHPAGHYSYVIAAGEEGRELIDYTDITEIENKHLWTVSEHEFKVEDDMGDVLFSETRYVFTNVATGQIFGWDGAKLGLCETANDFNCWYFTLKTPKEIFGGSAPLPYGTLGLQFNDGNNKYKYTTVDMRKSDLNISGSDLLMHALWNTYSSAFIFEPYEPEEIPEPETCRVYYAGEYTNPNVYGWTMDGETAIVKTAAWPGDAMTRAEEDYYGAALWYYDFVKENAPENVIFNSGSAQTDDLTYPGDNYVYIESTKEWVPFGQTPTAINSINTLDAAAKVYDLQGRRVAAPAKGLYIQNGAKVVR